MVYSDTSITAQNAIFQLFAKAFNRVKIGYREQAGNIRGQQFTTLQDDIQLSDANANLGEDDRSDGIDPTFQQNQEMGLNLTLHPPSIYSLNPSKCGVGSNQANPCLWGEINCALLTLHIFCSNI